MGLGIVRLDVAGQRASAERYADAHAGRPGAWIAGRHGVREDVRETAGDGYLKGQRSDGGQGMRVTERAPLKRGTGRPRPGTRPPPGPRWPRRPGTCDVPSRPARLSRLR